MMRRIIALSISFSLIFQQAGLAQVAPQLGVPAYLHNLPLVADKFRPVHLRSLSVSPATNNFDLLLDKGDAKQLQKPQIEEAAKKLLEYFQVGLALPNSMFWVNLRPDAPQDVIDPYLEKTDMGRVLLEADLQLKKDIARFTAPDTVEGRQYWDRLYRKADSLYGGRDVEIPTLTRPWIVPGEIIIGESKDSAYIYKATFKVMLEQDYLKDVVYTFDDDRAKEMNAYSSQIVRELIIPRLTREVNSSKRYASLRQVYYSLILAQWFKQKYKGTQGVYASRIDTRDLTRLVSKTAWSKDTYFREYQQSFKNGEYSRQETVYTTAGETIRSYFSGGLALNALDLGRQVAPVSSALVAGSPNNLKVTIDPEGNPHADFGPAAGRRDQGVIMIRDFKEVVDHIQKAPADTVVFLDFDDTVVGNGRTLMPQPEYFFGTRRSMNLAITDEQLIKEAAYLEALGIQASIDERVADVLDLFDAASDKNIPVYIITNRPESLRDSTIAVLKSLGILQGPGNHFKDIIFVGAGDGNKANKIRAYVDAARQRPQEVMFVDNLYLKALEVQEAFSDMPDLAVKAFHIDGTRQPEHSLREYESKMAELESGNNKTEMLLVAHGSLLQAAQNLVRAPQDPTTIESVDSLIAFVEKNGLQDVKPGYVQEYIDNIRAMQAPNAPIDGGFDDRATQEILALAFNSALELEALFEQLESGKAKAVLEKTSIYGTLVNWRKNPLKIKDIIRLGVLDSNPRAFDGQELRALLQTIDGSYTGRTHTEYNFADDLKGVSYPMTLMDVLQNILGNSMKWDKKGNPIKIAVNAIDGAKNLRIMVSDRGPGMSPETVQELHVPKDVQATTIDGTFSSKYGTPSIYRNVYNVLRGSIKLTSTWYDEESKTTQTVTRTDTFDEKTRKITPTVSNPQPSRPGDSTGCTYEITIPLENSTPLAEGATDFKGESIGKIRHDTYNQITIAAGILGLLAEMTPELEPEIAKAVEACRKVQRLLEETRKVHDLESIWENLLSSDDTLKELIIRADKGDVRIVQHSLTLKVNTVDPEDVTEIIPGQTREVKLLFDFDKNTMEFNGQTYDIRFRNRLHDKQYFKLADISYNAGKPGEYLYQSITGLIAPRLGFVGSGKINEYFTVEMGFLIIYDMETGKYRLQIDDVENGFEFFVLPDKTVVSVATFIAPNPKKPLGKSELIVAEGHFHPEGDDVLSAKDLAIMVNRAKNNHRVIPEIIATIMTRSKVEMVTAKADAFPDQADKAVKPVIVAADFQPIKEDRYVTYAYADRDYRDLPVVVAEFNKVVIEKQKNGEALFEEDMRDLLERAMNRQYIFEKLSPDGGQKDDPRKVIERTLRGKDKDLDLRGSFMTCIAALKVFGPSWGREYRVAALRELIGLLKYTREHHPDVFPEIARAFKKLAVEQIGDTHDVTDRVAPAAQELVKYIDSQILDGGRIGAGNLKGSLVIYDETSRNVLGKVEKIQLDGRGTKDVLLVDTYPEYRKVMDKAALEAISSFAPEAFSRAFLIVGDRMLLKDAQGQIYARQIDAKLLAALHTLAAYQKPFMGQYHRPPASSWKVRQSGRIPDPSKVREDLEAIAGPRPARSERIDPAGQTELFEFGKRDGGETAAPPVAVQDIYDRLFAGYRRLVAPDDELYADAFVLEESIIVDDTIESVAYLHGQVRINPKLAELLTTDEIAFAIAHEMGHHLFLARPLSSGPAYYRAWYLQRVLDRYFAKQLGREISIEENTQEVFYMSEFAADAIALQILNSAGSSLSGSLTAFQHINEIVRGFTVEEIRKVRASSKDRFEYTHPSNEDRLFRMLRLMEMGLPFSPGQEDGAEVYSLMEAMVGHMQDGLHPFAIGWWPINRRLSEIMNAQETVLGINSGEKGGAIEASVQNAVVDQSGKGGIDLRVLPLATKPLEALAASHGRRGLNVIDPKIIAALNSRWAQIQLQMQQGPMPYAQMKEYVISCNKEQAAEQINQVFACIANILRLEEDAAVATPQELKEILTTIG